MTTFRKVVDTSETPEVPSFALLFRRVKPETKEIPLLRWIWLIAVEVMFGIELLENLVTTASVSSSAEFGWSSTLNRHIPRGIVIDRFRSSLLDVLFYKHCIQYCMLNQMNSSTIHVDALEINATSAKFAIRKGILYQVIYFRRVYYGLFLLANIVFSLFVFFFSDSLTATALSFFAIHLGKSAKV